MRPFTFQKTELGEENFKNLENLLTDKFKPFKGPLTIPYLTPSS